MARDNPTWGQAGIAAPAAPARSAGAVIKRESERAVRAWLSGLDVCFGPLNTLPEAFDDPSVAARGMVLRDDLGRRHIAPVIRFQDEPPRPDLHEPQLGEHTDEVLGALKRGTPDAA